MAATPGYVSNTELAARISALVDRWDQREYQMIDLLTVEGGNVTVTDGRGKDHLIPSYRSLLTSVSGMVDDLSGAVAQVSDLTSSARRFSESATASSGRAAASATKAEELAGSIAGSVSAGKEELDGHIASAASSIAGSVSQAATSASDAASSASASAASASAAAASAAVSAAESLGASEDAVRASASRNEALAYQGGAEAARQIALNAQASAEAARDSAYQIANAPVGTALPDGGYSALHWAKQAQATATGTLVYLGTWATSSRAYPEEARTGHFYKVIDEGEIDGVRFNPGDQIVFNGEDWDKIDNTDQVSTVNGKSGAVVLTASDIGGLGALARKDRASWNSDIDGIPAEFPSRPHKHTKGDAGLSNVDNTSDRDKPVSIAAQAALDALAAAVDTKAESRELAALASSVAVLPTRNLLINGGLQFWQRRTSGRVGTGSGSLGSAAYFADRFHVSALDCTADVVRYAPPDRRTYQLVSISGAGAGGSACWTGQMIEGVRYPTGKVTISFLINANVDGLKVGVAVQQYFGTGGSPAPTNHISAGAFALTTAQQRISVTVDLPDTYGKNIGTAGNDYIHVLLELCGGQAGIQNGQFTIGEWQVEAGAKATPFEYRHPGYELALCQRYYELIGFIANSQGAYFTTLGYKVQKRTVPNLTVLGASIAPATLNTRGSERWFSMDGLAASAVGTYCAAECEF